MDELIPDDTPVVVSGYTDPETGEPADDRHGVIVSGGHTVDDVAHYEVQIDGDPYPALIVAERVTAE